VISLSDGVLQTLYVMPQCWGRGIGSTLHDFALDGYARRMSRRCVSGRSPKIIARAFYERRGWIVTGRTRVVPFPPYPIDVEYLRLTPRS
jgi:GNAT superfamily N-acetyltransferase